MQRNWDIIRKILLAVEALPTEDSQLTSNTEEVAYHMQLCWLEGLIVGGGESLNGKPITAYANRLTWEGHEFLDKIKNESIWRQVKAMAREKGVDLSFGVIKDLAKALIASVIS